MRYISEHSNPAVVQLFENGVSFVNLVSDKPAEISKPTDLPNSRFKARITNIIGPSEFYIQLNSDMEKELEFADDFLFLDDEDIREGQLCAARWEGTYYRGEIACINDLGK